jgi:hypothetical protein
LLDQILDRLFLTRCNYSRCSYNSAIGGHGGVSGNLSNRSQRYRL